MIKNRFSAALLPSLLVVCLMFSILPQPIQAKNGDDEKPILLHAVAEIAPIGKIFSLGAVSINGISASGEQTIWGGELLQSYSENGAKVSFDALGQITLKRGAMLRVASSSVVLQDETMRGMLVASLLCGEMNVKLQPGVGAYIQSCGRIFTASSGASFRIIARAGYATAETIDGTVQIKDTASQKKYFVRPVGIGSQLSVKARSARQIQVQVTDENDKPVPDLPIIFVLGNTGAGTLRAGGAQGATLTSPTNTQGIATVEYNA